MQHQVEVEGEEFPRDPTAREKAVLDLLLSVDFEGCEELRTQAATVQVSARDHTGIEFSVAPDAARAPLRWNMPVETRLRGFEDGVEKAVEFLLFAYNGYLSSLDVVAYGDEPPPELFPDLEELEPPRPYAPPSD